MPIESPPWVPPGLASPMAAGLPVTLPPVPPSAINPGPNPATGLLGALAFRDSAINVSVLFTQVITVGTLLLIFCANETTVGTTWSCKAPGSNNFFTAVPAANGGATAGQAQLLWKIADAQDVANALTNTVYTVVQAANHQACYVTAAYSPAFFDSPLGVSGQVNASSATISVAGFTTTNPGDTLVWFGYSGGGSGATPAITTPPPGFTPEILQINTATTTGATNVGLLMADTVQAAAGPTGNVNGTLASSHTNGGMLVALSSVPQWQPPQMQPVPPGMQSPQGLSSPLAWLAPYDPGPIPSGSTTNLITLSGLATASAAQQLGISVNDAATVTSLATVLRGIRATEGTTATASATVTRRINITHAALATASGTLATLKTKLLTLTGLSTASAALGRSVRLNEAAQTVASGSVIRGLSIALRPVATASATITTIKTKLLALSTTITASAALANRIGRLASASATASVSVLRQVGSKRVTSATASATVKRQVSTKLASTATASATVALLRVVLLTLQAVATGSATIVRQVRANMASQAVASATVFRRLPAKLTATVTASATQRVLIGKTMAASATASATATALKLRLLILNATATASGTIRRALSINLPGVAVAQPSVAKFMRQLLTASASAVGSLVPQTILSAIITLTKGLRGIMHRDRHGGSMTQDSLGGNVRSRSSDE